MPLSEEKPLLYHYTTGSGLLGIVESQQIHATSIAYLNDEEEHVGYFHRRLPALLDEAIADVLRSWSDFLPEVVLKFGTRQSHSVFLIPMQ